ncbi:ribosome-associated translation inhibitor RaiA [Aquimarina sp. ERC-38]|uniref:ribosome hibernation-promoting factor, HPF/YfiA family n=1 Tax=Aquimarina sp. ERC-38 TaxID=2949996 RepID=UPI0022464533|nr:ribosome-associated translation inhibitor RaiA [Aquimarina sp. ERC-38]UZO82474.1 ribosome-associated translation inhibitor RaiA [Aquimarina sp. ERC-38]
MNIIYEYANVSASDRLEAIVEEKLGKIGEKYPFVIRGDVFFKIEKRADNTGHVCGIRLSAPGPRLYASTDGTDFEGAIQETVRDLTDQLKKRKAKMQSH